MKTISVLSIYLLVLVLSEVLHAQDSINANEGALNYSPKVHQIAKNDDSSSLSPNKNMPRGSNNGRLNGIADPSAITSITIQSPVISIDLLMDLYDKNIDFDMSYTGANMPVFHADSVKRRPSDGEESTIVPPVSSKRTESESKPAIQEDGTKTKQYTMDDAMYNKAMIYLNNAQKYFSAKRYPDALVEINKSIDFAPNIALAHSVKGSIMYVLRRTGDAKQSWERALELDPTLDNIRALLLHIY
jgi:tetratricopeptide (TPR) repeat protein